MNEYLAHFRIAVKEELRYFISNSLLGGAGTLVYIVLTLLFWRATGQQEFFGVFTWGMLVWYLTLAQVLAASTDVVKVVNKDVREGTIAVMLSKPYHYVTGLLARHAGEASMHKLVTVALAIPIVLLMGGSKLTLMGIVFGTIASILSLVLNFLIRMSLGLIAFWTEDASPYRWIYQKILFIFGGLVFPLDILPATVQWIAKILPPAFVVYYPARLFVDFSWDLAFYVLGVQMIFLVALSAICYVVYKMAIRGVNINGG